MTNHIIETVLFRLEDGVSDAEFRETIPASTAFMHASPGFRRRRLSVSDDGQWIEHVEWADIASAKAAAACIGQDESVRPFVSKISGPSVQMFHTELTVIADASELDSRPGMRRTDRLFEILQIFRERGFLRAADLADMLEVSVRTIYRDLDSLIASGHPIDGERGVGYILREPIFLPPLKLTPDEAAALRLGMDLVKRVADAPLSRSADAVLRKLTPNPSRSGVSVYGSQPVSVGDISTLRACVDQCERVRLTYLSLDGRRSRRTVRPLQLEVWEHVWTLTAWCETREDFRTFRVDRIEDLLAMGERFPTESDKSYEAYLIRFETRDRQ